MLPVTPSSKSSMYTKNKIGVRTANLTDKAADLILTTRRTSQTTRLTTNSQHGGPHRHHGGPHRQHGGPHRHYVGPHSQHGGPHSQYGGPHTHNTADLTDHTADLYVDLLCPIKHKSFASAVTPEARCHCGDCTA